MTHLKKKWKLLMVDLSHIAPTNLSLSLNLTFIQNVKKWEAKDTLILIGLC